VRLAGGVADQGASAAHGGGHEDVLGAGDRGLIKKQLSPGERAGHGEVVGAVDGDFGAELHQSVKVRVQPAAANHIAPRRIQARPAGAVQKARHTQDGSAHLVAKRLADFAGGDAGHMDADALPAALDLAADLDDHVQHVAHIDDVGHVIEDDFSVRQDAGRNHGQDGVFVAGGADGAAQGHAAFNFKCRHGWIQ